MRYESHIVTSILAGTSITILTAIPFTFGYVAGVTLGSLIPDIDHPKSFIGKRSLGIGNLINRRYGHRGLTHSLFIWLVYSIIVLLIFYDFFGLGLSLGYIFHILGDLFSVSGVPLYKPFKSNRVKVPKYLTYKTSSNKESIIFSVSLILIFLLLPYALDSIFFDSFNIFVDEFFQIISVLIKFIFNDLRN